MLIRSRRLADVCVMAEVIAVLSSQSEGSELVGAMMGDGGVLPVGWRWLWGELWRRNWADSTAHHGFDVFVRMAISALAGRDRAKGRIWQCRAFLMTRPKCPTLAESAYNRSGGCHSEYQWTIWGCSSIAILVKRHRCERAKRSERIDPVFVSLLGV